MTRGWRTDGTTGRDSGDGHGYDVTIMTEDGGDADVFLIEILYKHSKAHGTEIYLFL